MRRNWLESVAGADEIDLEAFQKTLESLKKQAEIIQISVEEDAIRLDFVYEKQQLEMLIEATKPMEDGETDKMRDRRLTALAMEGTNEMRAALEVSVAERRRLADETTDLLRMCDTAKAMYENKGKMRGEEIKKRIDGYIQRLLEGVESGRTRLRGTTRDYLVLRHNAKVATEVLQRSENDAHRQREELQKSLEALTAETALHLERMEHGCREEIKKLTNSVREQVIKKERELEDLRQRDSAARMDDRAACKKYRRGIIEFEGRYEELQNKRRKDIRAITEVLRNLKAALQRAELALVNSTSGGHHTRVKEGGVSAAAGGMFGGSAASKSEAAQARALLGMLAKAAPPLSGTTRSSTRRSGSAGAATELDENVANATLPPRPPMDSGRSGFDGLEGLSALERMSTAGISLSQDEKDLLMLAARMKQLKDLSEGT